MCICVCGGVGVSACVCVCVCTCAWVHACMHVCIKPGGVPPDKLCLFPADES